jgi:hypothetical protein
VAPIISAVKFMEVSMLTDKVFLVKGSSFETCTN